MTPSFYEFLETLVSRMPSGMQVGNAVPASGSLFLAIVNCFRESNPDVEYPQPAADPADKAVGDECAQSRRRHQKMVVHPFRSPGKNHKKDAYNGTDQPERQYRNPMQPELQAHITASFGTPRRYLHSRRRSITAIRGRQLRQRAWSNCLGCIRIRCHRLLPKSVRVAGRVLQTHIPGVRE